MSPRLISISSSRQTVTDIGGNACSMFAVVGDDRAHAAGPPRRQHHDAIALA